MNFHEIRFPTNLSLGSSAGLERRTEIVTLVSGHEQRNTPWAQAKRRYDAGIGLRSIDELYSILDFYEARRGALYGFRWKDWLDHKSCAPTKTPSATDQVIGSGDGSTSAFQIEKTYGTIQPLQRPIKKPLAHTVLVAISGDELNAGSDFQVDETTGSITFSTPPPQGTIVTSGFEFDTPVRFATDVLEIDLAAFNAGEVPSIPIVEVRL